MPSYDHNYEIRVTQFEGKKNHICKSLILIWGKKIKIVSFL